MKLQLFSLYHHDLHNQALARVGEAEGYPVWLLPIFQRTYKQQHFENTTSRLQIIQESNVTTGFAKTFLF